MKTRKSETEKNLEYCLDLLYYIIKGTKITYKRISRYLGKATNYLSHVMKEVNTLNMQTFLKILELYNITPQVFFSDKYYKIFFEYGNPNYSETVKTLNFNAEKKLKKLGI